jgi:uncharacterized membrane protein (GlpM family)
MAWILGVLALVIGALVLIVTTYMAGHLIPPIYDIVIQNDAVKAQGFDTGVETAAQMGLMFVPPLLAFSIVVWFLVLRLRRDTFAGQRPR